MKRKEGAPVPDETRALPSITEPASVRVHPAAEREIERGLFEQRIAELLWFVRKLRELEGWPPPARQDDILATDLAIEALAEWAAGVYQAEIPPRWPHEAGARGVLAYFWVEARRRGGGGGGSVVWVLHGRRESVVTITASVRRRVLRRLHDVKGHLQDGAASS